MQKRYIGIFGVLAVLVVIVALMLTPAGPLAAADTQATTGPALTQALTTTDTQTTTDTFGLVATFLIAFGLVGGAVTLAARSSPLGGDPYAANHKTTTTQAANSSPTGTKNDVTTAACNTHKRGTDVVQGPGTTPQATVTTKPLVDSGVTRTSSLATTRRSGGFVHTHDIATGHQTTQHQGVVADHRLIGIGTTPPTSRPTAIAGY